MADVSADLCRVRFKREVAGFIKAHFRIRNVAFECLGSRWQENGVVPAPGCQQRRTARANALLKPRIWRNVGSIVQEQVELNFVVSRTRDERSVQRVALGSDQARIRDALRVLRPPNRLGLEQLA